MIEKNSKLSLIILIINKIKLFLIIFNNLNSTWIWSSLLYVADVVTHNDFMRLLYANAEVYHMRNHPNDVLVVDLRLSRDVCVERDESEFRVSLRTCPKRERDPRFVGLPRLLFLEFKRGCGCCTVTLRRLP